MAEWGESRVEAANAKARAVKDAVILLNTAVLDALQEGVSVEFGTIENTTIGVGAYTLLTAKTTLELIPL